MNLLKLVMSKDQEYAIIDAIGQREMAHFIDINQDEEVYTLPYMEMLRRCEDAERRMLAIIQQCKQHEVPLGRVRSVGSLAELTQAFAEARKTVS